MGHQPNFLFFLPDQHRPDWLGVNKALPLRTPNLDALAARGVRFTRAYTPSPLCAPARACLASGRAYGACRVFGNRQDYPLDLPTYYQRLRDGGCRVAGVGKFDLHKDLTKPLFWGLDGSRLLSEWGFTEGIDNEGKMDGSNSYLSSGRQPQGPYLHFLEQRGLADLYVAEHGRRKECMSAYTTALPDEAYCDNWLSENGLRFLRGFPQGQPWHLAVNFTGPHGPMDVTAPMRDRWKDVPFPPPHDNAHEDREGLLRVRQNYAAMIENIDRQVGRFLAMAEERGELDDTIVVYSSDHGEMLGDHSRGGKGTWYEPSSGIPLIVAGPGVRKGHVSDALVSLHDLAATFLDYAQLGPLPASDARSLRPLLESATDEHRQFIYSGLFDPDLHGWDMIVEGRHKLVRTDERFLLYDLESDPNEDCDLADREPEAVERLRTRFALRRGPDANDGRGRPARGAAR